MRHPVIRQVIRSITLVTGLLAFALVSLGLLQPADSTPVPAVFCVTPGGTSEASGSCWDDPLDLRTALRIARSGDQIRVAEGVYSPGDHPNNTFWLPAGVEILGGFTANPDDQNERRDDPSRTVLTGNDVNYSVVTAAGVRYVTLDNFTITGGSAGLVAVDALETQRRGGGLFITNSIVRASNLIVVDNQARVGGGGIYVDGESDVVLERVEIRDNSLTHVTSGRGGGMRVVSGTASLSDVTFADNAGVRGGGLYVDGGVVTIEGSRFIENRATDAGGALYVAGGEVVLRASDLMENVATNRGGGIAIDGAGATLAISNATINGNASTGRGGGIYGAHATVTVTDSTIMENASGFIGGGGMSAYQLELQIRNSFIQGNLARRGGGLLLISSRATLVNAVITGNRADRLTDMAPPRSRGDDPVQQVGSAESHAREEALVLVILDSMVTQRPASDDPDILDYAGGGVLASRGSDVVIVNSTISANASRSFGAGVYGSGGSVVDVLNSIVHGNLDLRSGDVDAGQSQISTELSPGYTLTMFVDHSLIGGGCPALYGLVCWTVFDRDPRFLVAPDPSSAPTAAGDFRLWFSSPAIDAGSDEYFSDGDRVDIAGHERFAPHPLHAHRWWAGWVIDLGAFETSPPLPATEARLHVELDGDAVYLVADVTSTGSGRLTGSVRLRVEGQSISDVRTVELVNDGDGWTLYATGVLDGGRPVAIALATRSGPDGRDEVRVRLDDGFDSGWQPIASGVAQR
jgi:hypothetical protein